MKKNYIFDNIASDARSSVLLCILHQDDTFLLENYVEEMRRKK